MAKQKPKPTRERPSDTPEQDRSTQPDQPKQPERPPEAFPTRKGKKFGHN